MSCASLCAPRARLISVRMQLQQGATIRILDPVGKRGMLRELITWSRSCGCGCVAGATGNGHGMATSCQLPVGDPASSAAAAVAVAVSGMRAKIYGQ